MITLLKKTILSVAILFITCFHIQTMHVESEIYTFKNEKYTPSYQTDIQLLNAIKLTIEQNFFENTTDQKNNSISRHGSQLNNSKNCGLPLSPSETRENIQKFFEEENPCNKPEIAAILQAARNQKPVESHKSAPLFSLFDIIKSIDIESLKIARQQLLDAKIKIEQELSKKRVKGKKALKKQQFLINNQLIFIDCLLDKSIISLLYQIEYTLPNVACQSFETLRQLWPWKPKTGREWCNGRKRSFLCDSLITPEQQAFIDLLPCNIIQKAEECLVSRQDVLYLISSQQCGSIRDAFKNYHKLQMRGEQKILLNEKRTLEYLLNSKYNVDTLPFLRANLATVNKLLSDPLTTIYANIAYGDLAIAQVQIYDFEQQVGIECINHNIFTYDKARAYFEKKYGYNILSTIRNCYISRPDYCYKDKCESVFSRPLMKTLATIAEGDFYCANNALKDLEQQMIKKYGSALSDPQEVYENMVQDEGFNIIEVAYKAFESRPDYHKRKHELTPVFEPINIQQNIIESIDSYTDNITLAGKLEELSYKVFDHVNEHGYNVPTIIESEVDNSIETIKIAESPITLIFNIAKVDHLLNNVQTLICYAEQHLPHSVKRPLELLVRGAAKFITGLNPVEQLKNVYELAEIVGKISFNIDLYPKETAEKICAFIIKTACFIDDGTICDELLPFEEVQRRADKFCMYFEDLPLQDFENLITAENIVDIIGQALADSMFLSGVGTVAKFAKNINILSKINCRAGKVAEKLKKTIQLRLDQPVLVTAESASEMASQIKNINKSKNTAKIAIEFDKFCPPSCVNQGKKLNESLQITEATLIKELLIEEFNKIIKTTKHGIERLIERNFSPEEVLSLLKEPHWIKTQADGANVYIQEVASKYRIIILNEKTQELVTAIKGTTRKKIERLGERYGWKF